MFPLAARQEMNSTAAAARARKRGPSRTEQLGELRRTELEAPQSSQMKPKPSRTGSDTKKARKAETEKAAVKAWNAVAPLLESAAADDVQALVKSLFTVAHEHAPRAAAEALEVFVKAEVAAAAAAAASPTRPQFDGRWILYDGGEKVGVLDVDSAELLLENAMDDYCGLEQIHDIDWSTRDYTYQGEIMSWGRVRDDFIVKVLVSHDPDTDELEGEVDVAPLRRVDYGHDDEFGGAFSFRGERALE